ncbi:MAG: 4Fe-4S binding protein [Tissierellia bacterium]|nr:4Fe-4S binding protein [Tissierellia bacterium]
MMKRYEVTKSCVKCGACVDNCPVGCISFEEKQCIIDEEKCIRCGMCYQVCSFDAIKIIEED